MCSSATFGFDWRGACYTVTIVDAGESLRRAASAVSQRPPRAASALATARCTLPS
jgi:hypothetical protein